MVPERGSKKEIKRWALTSLYSYICTSCRKRIVDFSPRKVCVKCEQDHYASRVLTGLFRS